MDASQNAERFYARHGYVVTGRGQHVLRSGQKMASRWAVDRASRSSFVTTNVSPSRQ